MKRNTQMSFLDHLEVLRWHLIRSFCAIFFAALFAFIFKEFVFDSILLAPKKVDFLTYRLLCNISDYVGLGGALCLEDSPFTLMNITMSGQFITHLKTSFFAGFIISFPYVLWEFWRFIYPALYEEETQAAKFFVFFSSLLFLTGVLFGYFIIAPLSLNFLGSYQVSSMVANQINLGSFISTIITVCLANGIIFELPIIVYFLTKLGILTPQFMRVHRKHAIIAALILSAIITPPDIASQIFVTFPLIFLYEISIKISQRILDKKKIS